MRASYARSLSVFHVFCVAALAGNAPAPNTVSASYLKLPLSFERQGSGAAQRYLAHGPGYTVGIDGTKTIIGVVSSEGRPQPGEQSTRLTESRAVSLEFAGGKRVVPTPGAELTGKVNRISGNDRALWKTGLSTFESVAYPGVYPGIDIVYYGTQQQLEFDLVVKPGADPNAIRLKIGGADEISIDSDGSLRLGKADGLKVALPQIYQDINGTRKRIKGKYTIHSKNEVAFRVEAWDHNRPLVIDPTIVYSTLFGGGLNTTLAEAVAVDGSGNVFITGYTFAADFPVLNPAQGGFAGNGDVFVSKINAAGTALLYSTYVGGSAFEFGYGLAVDSSGAAWVAGYTQSTDFPVLSAAQVTIGGLTDAFVFKLNAAGVLQFSTYLGGSDYEYAYAVAVDSAGNGYITGQSGGAFPTTSGVIQTANQLGDAFVAKYSASGALAYSTLLGGATYDYAYGIAVDPSGNAYVTGVTYSSSFTGAPAGGAQPLNAGGGDAFVTKINSTATSILYHTFLGGAGYDQGKAIRVDASGNSYIAGQTSSPGLATSGAAQAGYSGGTDGFAAKLNSAGSVFSYITYVGGSRQDSLTSLALDGSGNVYLAGSTFSANFPAVSALQPSMAGNSVSLFGTSNSAASWTASDSNLPGAVSAISVNPSGASTVVLTDSGIYRTVNGGATWSLQFSASAPFGSGYLNRSPASPSTIYAVVCCSTVVRSNDDGLTWNYIGVPIGQALGLLVDPLAANTLYVFGYAPPYVSKSTDGGATWNPAATGLPNATVQAMTATTDGVIFVGTAGSGIYKSTNQGASWTAVNTGLPSGAYASPYSLSASGTTVYFSWGTIFVTTNGGTSWSQTPGYVGANEVAASPQNASVLYALTYNNSVQKSSDGGATWGSAGTGLSTSLLYYQAALVIDPSNSARAFVVSQLNQSAFAAKLNSAGTGFLWSTYLGGVNTSYANGVATDGTGDAFITGFTGGSGFPATSTALAAGTYGTFLTKISDATAACSVTISPGNVTTSPYGQTLHYSVVAPSGCSWTASTNQSFATILSSASGTGTGSLTVQIAYNSTASTQTATLTVGSQSVTITQPSGSCSFSLDQSSYSIGAGGGTVTAALTATAGCPWSANNNYPGALSFTTPSSGTGGATIKISVTPNLSTATRSFDLSVGTTSIQITQLSNLVNVSTTGLPTAYIGVPYSATLAATGGTAPYSNWTVSSGSLPPGLTLNSSTGVIAGAPTSSAGSPFVFSVTVNDNAGHTSSAMSLSITVGPAPSFPGQGEPIASGRAATAQPLLFSFVTNQLGFDSEITIANTSLDTVSSAPQSGTCALSFYGLDTPTPSSGVAVPGGTIFSGSTRVFLLSSVAPAFQGYMIIQCSFPGARGSSRIAYNAGHTNAVVESEDAQVLSLPRSVPTSRSFLFPFVSNQLGFDFGIVVANTSADPFGASGAAPTSGSCTLSFYGSGAPTPSTGIQIPTGTLFAGSTSAFLLSSVAPGFQGYMIVQCNFGAAAAYGFNAWNLTQNNGVLFSETPETISLPRSSVSQPLLFTVATNQNGQDTGLAIANTSADPFGASGATPSAGTCTLNFYGTNAPVSPFVTPNIPAGTVYTTTLSSRAPGFSGYIAASCSLGAVRGFSYVLRNFTQNGMGPYDYSGVPEVVQTPRSNTSPSHLLFNNVSSVGANDTNVVISNTSADPFGSTAGSGSCTINYYGTVAGTIQQQTQTSTVISAGGQLAFSVAQGNASQGISANPGFRGYMIADCGFPLARGTAEIGGTPGTVIVATAVLAPGTSGVAYSQTLAAGSGVAPYGQWTVFSGALPPGLTLNPSTGVIGGTPNVSVAAIYTFSVTVQDNLGYVSAPQPLSIAIGLAATPVIAAVVNGASFSGSLVPGEVAAIFGSSLAGSTAVGSVPYGTTIAGVTVKVNGTLAPLFFVSSGQINFQVPSGTATGTATIIVTYAGVSSTGFQITVVTASPAMFLFSNTQAAIAQNADFSLNTAAYPAAPASLLRIYFTGGGLTTPAVADGTPAPASPLSPFTVAGTTATVGGVSASVAFAGLTPASDSGPINNNVGIDEVRLTVPAGLSAGSYSVVITVNGVPSNAATIFVGGAPASVTSVTPNTVPAFSATTPVTITGTNFGGGSVVAFTPPGAATATLISPSLIQAAQIAASIPAALLTTAGTAQVSVQSGLGAVTSQLPFTITASVATTTGLSFPSPSVFGHAVTMTATVLPSTATGSVTFYNGTTIVGSAPVLNGSATLTTTLLPAGTVSLKARYVGGGGYAPSSSSVNAITVSALPANGFQLPAATYGSGIQPWSIAVADFNGDGKQDMAVVFIGSGIEVMLGNGDGTFGSPVTYAAGVGPQSIGAGDFNGDGKIDLAVANANCGTGNGSISILLGNGDGTFQSAVSFAGTASCLVSVAIGDFNLDGRADLVALSLNGPMNVFIGNGDGTLQAPVSYALPPRSYGSVAIADFNRDGYPDLAVANPGGIFLFAGNGDGSFRNPSLIVVPTGNIAAGDFNGDGKIDIAATNSGVSILLGNGDGTFQSATSYLPGTGPQGNIASGDFNGDGNIDLAFATGSSNTTLTLLGYGDGTFRQTPLSTALGNFPAFVAVGDFNGDGRVDLAVPNLTGGNVSVLLGIPTTGSTTTTLAAPSTSVYNQQITLTARVAPSGAGGNVTFKDGSVTLGLVGLFSGFASFSTSTLAAGTHSLTAIYSGDANFAGSTSSVVTETVNPATPVVTLVSSANPAAAGQTITLITTVAPSLATGTITFKDGGSTLGAATLSGGTASFAVSALGAGLHSLSAVYGGDVNDSTGVSPALTETIDQPSVTTATTLVSAPNPSAFGQSVTMTATVSPSAAGNVTFYDGTTVLGTKTLSGSQASFTTKLLASGARSLRAFFGLGPTFASSSASSLRHVVGASPVASNGYQPATQYPTGSDPEYVVTGDFNGDNKPDLAVVNFTSTNVSILLGNGDGTFAAAVNYPISGNAFGLALGDFNDDGKVDLAVGFANTTTSVLLGNGDGTFQPAVNYNGGGFYVVTGDFNADGKTDLATIGFTGAAVFLGNGDGTFGAAVTYPTGAGVQRPFGINAGDFNGDGIVDLAVSNTGLGTVGILFGKGDGTFQLGATYPTGSQPREIAVGDFNGDGKADLAIANIGDATVSVLRGNGDGTFQPATTLALGTSNSTWHVVASDLNGDGKTDLAVGTIGTLIVLLGNGDGTFQLPVSYLSNGLAGIALADFNNDGAMDIATATSGVSVFLGIPAGPSVKIETPSPNASLTGATTISGWALESISSVGPNAISSVSVYLDNTLAGTATYGLSRPDVCAALPGRPGCPNVGWSYSLDVSSVAGGSHALNVIATDSAGKTGSSQISFSIPIAVTSVTPNTAPSGSGATPITVNGSNFGAGFKVLFTPPGGAPNQIAPSLIQAAQLAATVPAALLTSAGTASVAIQNGAGVISNPVPFFITPFTITGIIPGGVAAGSDATPLKITGSNLSTATGLSFTPPRGSPHTIPLGLIQAAQAQAIIPAAYLTSAGTAQVALTNAAGALSNPISFDVGAALSAPVINLASSANPVSFGHSVTLTATISPSSATGQVTFYDGTTVLGSGTLSQGAATLSTSLLRSGARSLSALYLGDANNAPRLSAVIPQTVNALPSTTLAAAVNYATGPTPRSFGVGDFNGDGIADLAVTYYNIANPGSVSNVGIFIGNGDGTFRSAVTYPVGATPFSVTVGDFNADGRSDLAVANQSGSISVLLGNGDGTFQAAATYATGGAPTIVIASDFNRDGRVDLAFSNAGSVGVMLGNGDGTFLDAVQFGIGSPVGVAVSVASGDFNGDGIPDLVTANFTGNNVSILIGNGDGTFQTATTLVTASQAYSVAVGDLNGDGFADLAVANTAGNVVSVLLGNGNGTFNPAVNYAAGTGPRAIAIGDINGDGIPDIAVADNGATNAFVLTGKGDGTFNAAVSYPAGSTPTAIVIADFNGDGRSDLAVANYNGNNFSVLLGVSAVPSVTIEAPSVGSTLSGVTTISGWAVESISQAGPNAISSVVVQIDGTQVGTATYGVARADVCTVLPGRPGCPNVGWTYSLDASALSSGSHTLKVIATDSAGNTGLSQVSFTSNPVVPFVTIEAPASNSSLSGTVTVSGWAVEGLSQAGPNAISTVAVLVDGTQVGTATYGQARADVCAALPGRPGCPNVGWTYSLNAAALSAGSHTLKVVATDSAGTAGSSQITITSTPVAPWVTIDVPSANASLTGTVTISGWSVEGLSQVGPNAISSVTVLVDGATAGTAVYGQSRADVCAALPGRLGCPNVGWTYSLNASALTAGSHTLKIVATDSAGNTGFSQTTFTSTPVLPFITIEVPSANASLTGTVAIGGWAVEGLGQVGPNAISTVTVQVDGATVGTATYGQARADVCAALPGRPGCPNVGWTYNLNASALSAGSHTLKVIATDAGGNSGFAQSTFTSTPVLPFITIEVPSANASLTGTVAVGGWAVESLSQAGPNAVSSVTVQVDGATVGTATYGLARADVCTVLPGRPGCPNVGWSYNLNASALSAGSHTLKVIATDTGGNSSSSQVAFTAVPVTPWVSIEVAPGSTLSGVTTITGWSVEGLGQVGPNGVSTVTVQVDGTTVGTATYGAARADVCAVLPGRVGCPNVGWSYNLDVTSLSSGAHTLKVIATDTGGNSGFSTVSINVSAVVPWVNIEVAPGTTLSGLATITGWSVEGLPAAGPNAIASITVQVDGTTVGTGTYGLARADVCNALPGRLGCPNVGWSYSLDTSALSNGNHTLKVIATDTGGVTGSSTVSFSVGLAPFVFIDAPGANALMNGTTSISGWALEALSGVARMR